MGVVTKHLGAWLVDKGLITPEQLKAALEEQRSTKELLGRLLVRKGWLTHETLLKTLAEQFGIPFMHLDLEAIDWTVPGRFSGSAMAEHHCLPIQMDPKSVTVAIANPLEAWGLSQIEQAAGERRVHPVLVPDEELKAALQRHQQIIVQAIHAKVSENSVDDRDKAGPTPR